jgi:hypothetical protein
MRAPARSYTVLRTDLAYRITFFFIDVPRYKLLRHALATLTVFLSTRPLRSTLARSNSKHGLVLWFFPQQKKTSLLRETRSEFVSTKHRAQRFQCRSGTERWNSPEKAVILIARVARVIRSINENG